MSSQRFWVYVVKCRSGEFYTGQTADLTRRLAEHNGSRRGARFTAGRGPVRLCGAWEVRSRGDALRVEAFIRRGGRRRKLEILSDPSGLQRLVRAAGIAALASWGGSSVDHIILKRIVIHATAGTVYRALTESEPLARWFADRAESRPIVGGSLVLMWGTGDGTRGARAVFTQLVPDREAAVRWVTKIRPGESTPVDGEHVSDFLIDPSPEGVIVTMRDEVSPMPSDADRVKMDQEWDQTLVALKALCEGPDAPAPGAPVPTSYRPAAVLAMPPRLRTVPTKKTKKAAKKKARKKPIKKAKKKKKAAGRKTKKKGARKPTRKPTRKRTRKRTRKPTKGRARKSARKKTARRTSKRPARKTKKKVARKKGVRKTARKRTQRKR